MKRLRIALLGTMYVAMASCGGASQASAPAAAAPSAKQASAAALQPVRFVSLNSANFAPLFVALEKGYFREAGVDVTWAQTGAGVNPAMMAATGQIDAVPILISAAEFNAVAGGLPNKIVSSMGCVPFEGAPTAVVVRKDLAESVRTPADLRGRKVGLVMGATGGQAYELALVLREAGLTLKDVFIVTVQTGNETLAALKAGSIDAAYFSTPGKEEVVGQGIGAVLSPARKPGHCAVGTVFGSKFLSERPEQARATMIGLVRAARDIQGPRFKSEDKLAIVAKYTKVPVETIRASDPPYFRPDLAPDAETALDMQRVYLSEGLLTYSTPLSAEQLIDSSFSKYAVDKLGPYKG